MGSSASSTKTTEANRAAITLAGSGGALARLNTEDGYVLSLILGQVTLDEVAPKDGQAIHAEIMASVADAETAEELFNPAELAKGLGYLGVPLVIRDVTFRPSNFPEGPAVFAIVDATNAEGEAVRFSMGWQDVMWRLYLAKRRGYLPTPFAVKFERMTGETAGGFQPIKLRQA